MAKCKLIGFLFVTAFLTGCQANTSQPNLPSEGNVTGTATPQNQASATSTSQNTPVRRDNLEYLTGQLTTMQEQVIQIKADTTELKQVNQIILARLQMPSPNQMNASTSESAPSQDNSADFQHIAGQLDQLVNKEEGEYQLTSAYTAKGQWVLIRYNRFSGEAWLADNGKWNLMKESDDLSPSLYEVQILRAEKDIKGYVAARVDKKNGQTWWLKQDTWLKFQ